MVLERMLGQDRRMTSRADRSAPIAHGIRAGAATAVGHRRRVNEDAHVIGPGFAVVADGMGGHRGGDRASRIVVECFDGERDGDELRRLDTIRELVTRCHHRIVEAGADGEHAGMGTTIVGAVTIDRPAGCVAVFHVGDSRCYRLVDGHLTLVTADHTHVRELVDAGHLDPDDAAHHPLRNVVTRALGVELGDGPDVTVVAPPIGRLLLCTDGLWADLSARTIGRVLAGIDDPQAAADRLVELALAGPARDNITAVVVDPGPARSRPSASPVVPVDAPSIPCGRGDSRETGAERP